MSNQDILVLYLLNGLKLHKHFAVHNSLHQHFQWRYFMSRTTQICFEYFDISTCLVLNSILDLATKAGIKHFNNINVIVLFSNAMNAGTFIRSTHV